MKKYLELNKTHFVLSKFLIDNKVVFICRNKENFLYDFFYNTHQGFVHVDESMNKLCNNIFKTKNNDYVYLYVSNKFNEAEIKYITNIHKFCKDLILKNIQDLPIEIRENITKQLDGVSYMYDKLDQKFIAAFYQYSNNSIHINTNSYKSKYDVSKILHELLHCCSSRSFKSSCGFTTDKYLMNKSNSKIRIHECINEAYTEILRTEYLKNNPEFDYDKNIMSLYSPIQYILNNILKYINQKELKLAYFNSNSNQMIELITKEFCLKNNEDAIKLSMLFDMVLDCIFYEFGKSQEYSYTYQLLYELESHICKMVVNKYKKENKDISKLKFHNIFQPVPEITVLDKLYNNSLKQTKKYFYLIKTQETVKIKNNNIISSQSIYKEYLTIFLENLYNNNSLPIDFPEEAKLKSFFNVAVSKKIINNGKYIQLKDYESILNIMLDKNMNYLPTDINEQIDILNGIIYNPTLPIQQYSKYYPKDTLALLVNNNLKTFEFVCKNDIMCLYNIVDFISPLRKTTKVFYTSFFNAIANNENKLQLLQEYFLSLKKQQYHIENNENFLLYAKNVLKLNQSQYNTILNSIKDISKEK